MKSKTVIQSSISKGVAIGWFSTNGYIVSLPITNHMDYDILVDKTKIQKVRIISSTHKNVYGKWELSLRQMCADYSGAIVLKKFDKTKYDLIFMVCGMDKNRELFLFPSDEITCTTKITPENYPTYRIT